jgi:hypothetical protein
VQRKALWSDLLNKSVTLKVTTTAMRLMDQMGEPALLQSVVLQPLCSPLSLSRALCLLSHYLPLSLSLSLSLSLRRL